MQGTAALSANDVWSVGDWLNPSSNHIQTLAEHWNGTTWTKVATANPGVRNNWLFSVAAISPTNAWAVGFFDIGPVGFNQAATLAEHWNGTTWTRVVTPNNDVGSYLYAVTAVSATNVWAVGQYFNFNTHTFNTLIEHYNGSVWTDSHVTDPDPLASSQLLAVSAFNANDIWAVGSLTPSGGDHFQPLSEHFDGSSWTQRPSNFNTGGTEILGVSVLEANHAVGVGYGSQSGNPLQGTTWDLTLGSGSESGLIGTAGNNVFEAVARSGDGVWAVGYTEASSSSPPQTLAWAGTWDAGTHTLTWGVQGTSANPSAINDELFSVAAISPSVFWGVGFEDTPTHDQTLTELFCGLHFDVTAPANAVPNVPFNVTVTAKNADNSTATDYVGTIHFTSSDPQATLPPDFTFNSGDAGTKTFIAGVTLVDTYHQPSSITVSDTVTPFVTGTANITVACQGACQGPGGSPGGRGGSTGPGGTPGGRGGSPAPPAPPGPRLPIRSGSGLPGLTPPSVAIPRTHLPVRAIAASAVAAPVASNHLIGSVFRPRMVRGATPTYAVTLAAAVAPAAPKPGPAPWYWLLVLPLLVASLGFFARTRKRSD